MITSLTQAEPAIFYPSSDGEPLAESYDHLYAILTILEVLRVYLSDRRATVLADQFLYYVEGNSQQRVAPDVMVIFNVEPGGRDNYKIWEEGEVPSVIFEVTSPSTRDRDEGLKKDLYQELGVLEYWQFDPRNEWIPGQIRGYRLEARGVYVSIEDGCSQCLNLRLTVEDKLLVFYRMDNGERLLPPGELATARQVAEASRQVAEAALQEEKASRQVAETALQETTVSLERERQRAAELEARLTRYEQPENL
jgi:Uma2 family endonuclease